MNQSAQARAVDALTFLFTALLCAMLLRGGAALPAMAAETEPASIPTPAGKVAPKPLYRDPIHDGAADPVLVWNRAEGKWLMLYTNRRANVPGLKGVAWVHGTRLGIAESSDGGASWTYRGVAEIALGGAGAR